MNSLTGTVTLIRLILRRDRTILPIWIGISVMPVIGVAIGFAKLYPTAEALRAFADECMSNPAIVAMLGPVLAPTRGGLVAWRTGVMGMLAGAIPSLLLVVRHTRAEEETGRRELIGASVVGRQAFLSAALIVIMAANLLLATAIASSLISLGLPIGGSIAFGFSWAAAGWMFVGLAAVAAQLARTARGATGMVLTTFGVFFLIRMIGDSQGEHSAISWLSWVSPLGWTRLTRPFAGEQWWVFAIILALTLSLVAAAYALSSQRDLGAGFLSERPGPAEASQWLRSPLALAWRLQRGTLLGWALGFGVIGLLLGAVGETATRLVSSPGLSHWLSVMHANDPGHAFLRIIIYVLGQVTAAYAIAAALTSRSEETGQRAEPILATAVSRSRWAGSHLVFAFGGSAMVLAATGLAIGLTYGLSAGDLGREFPGIFALTIRTLPAVWVVAGFAMLLYGLAPRYAISGSWFALAFCLLVELGWELRQLSQSVFNISPFAYVHWVAAGVSLASLFGLTIVAAGLTFGGLIALNHRDID